MQSKKELIITFDYEPFLGFKSGTSQNCLIKPTNAVQAILNKYNAKATFFVDTLYILNLKKYKLQDEYIAITNQIKSLHNNGHCIFPHIHPHWLDAKFLSEIKQFDLSNLEKYALSSIDKNQIDELFSQSFSLLNELGIIYNEWGYRAGGWCIQPFTKFIDSFNKYNIKYEFSVLPNYKNEKQEQYFDFTTISKKTPYKFQNDVVTEDKTGAFTEFPISTIEISNSTILFSRIVNKYLWKTNDKGFGDGYGAQTSALKTTLQKSEMISIDILNIAKLNTYKKFIKNNHYMHFISHPKMLTRHGLKTLDYFLKFAHSNFEISYNSFIL